ncbi:MAG: hypothetical protein QM710_02555 [Flavobacterium sp.]
MEENKLFDQIKSAAENTEPKDFPGMEKVWQRVEEKLDNKIVAKSAWRWKRIAVAASLLLLGTLGYQLLRNDSQTIKASDTITATDSIDKPKIKDAIVTAAPEHPEIKKNAAQILQQQLQPENQVALEEKPGVHPATESNTPLQSGNSYLSDPAFEANNAAKEEAKSSELEFFIDRNRKTITQEKKEQPLVVINDKIMKGGKLENIEFTEADSLVVLKEPLYIINGVEYTEQEVFGPNPTSPYTPLNKQEVETISILQNEKAVEAYGKKGEKGVVIITTKDGKPSGAPKEKK